MRPFRSLLFDLPLLTFALAQPSAGMVLRLHWPRREVLTAEWFPAVVTRIDESR